MTRVSNDEQRERAGQQATSPRTCYYYNLASICRCMSDRYISPNVRPRARTLCFGHTSRNSLLKITIRPVPKSTWIFHNSKVSQWWIWELRLTSFHKNNKSCVNIHDLPPLLGLVDETCPIGFLGFHHVSHELTWQPSCRVLSHFTL